MSNEPNEPIYSGFIEPAEPPADGWLIHKGGRGWYRPDAAGYTNNPAEAGRYTYAKAMGYSHPNGLEGPRDGMEIYHESEVPGAVAEPPAVGADMAAQVAELREKVGRMTAAAREHNSWLLTHNLDMRPDCPDAWLEALADDLDAALPAIDAQGARIAELEAFIFDLVSGATCDFTAEQLADACALTKPKAQEIFVVAQAWFNRETGAVQP